MPVVTANAPTESVMPLSIGAMKSASERFGLSSAITSCCRSIGKRAAIFFGRPASDAVHSTISSPSLFAGQKP